MSTELVLSVIRGERPLAALREAHVKFNCYQVDSKSKRIVVKSREQLMVKPQATDVAQGMLHYKAQPEDLREWGTFILAADLINLEALEQHPRGDDLLNGLWDASFTGAISEGVLAIAEGLAAPPTEL